MNNTRSGSSKAFTLIELLIVIAIIAILALIAIPNFLEAQTRSKISRAMADMRSVAVAVEAYYVDYNSYFQCAHDGTGSGKSTPPAVPAAHAVANWYGNYSRMTTPVAYITSIPNDPFNKNSVDANRNPVPQHYIYYSGNIDETVGARTCFVLISKGPDLVNDVAWLLQTESDGSPKYVDCNYAGPLAGNDQANDLRYDPTNGTISTGDLFRAGGAADFQRRFERFGAKGTQAPM